MTRITDFRMLKGHLFLHSGDRSRCHFELRFYRIVYPHTTQYTMYAQLRQGQIAFGGCQAGLYSKERAQRIQVIEVFPHATLEPICLQVCCGLSFGKLAAQQGVALALFFIGGQSALSFLKGC